MKHCFVLAGLFSGIGLGLHAQVMDVTVCDVVKKPASYDGKMVRIKGTVIVGFDEFSIKDAPDPNCGFPGTPLALLSTRNEGEGRTGGFADDSAGAELRRQVHAANSRSGDARQEQRLQAVRFALHSRTRRAPTCASGARATR